MPVGIGPPVIGHLIITALMAPTRSLPRAQDTIGSFGQARKISVRNGTNDSADQSPVFRLRQAVGAPGAPLDAFSIEDHDLASTGVDELLA